MIDDPRLPATLTAPSVSRPGAPKTSRLLVVYSADASYLGQSMVLTPPGLVIGRESGPDTWVLGDSELSRRHAQFTPDGDHWQLQDEGSHNGTFVLGKRSAKARLRAHDIIRVGSTLLLYQELDLDDSTPRSAETPLLVGRSYEMQKLRGRISLAAEHGAPVLVLGPSGVGKELCAREVHKQSKRSGHFVAVNCAALPENLVESELFGHVAGAFTGASSKEGLFVAADHGTLLLDEIAEMALPMQAKLLRALSAGEVRPVGAAKPRRVDVKIVAATLKDLASKVEDKTFRGDLYARLAGQTIQVPSLEERREDVLDLCRKFIESDGKAISFSAPAAEALLSYGWPYNVRELENAMNVAGAAVRRRGSLELCDLPEAVQAVLRTENIAARASTTPSTVASARKTRPDASELETLLEASQGNVAEVARNLGVDRRQVYRWLDHYDIKR